MISKGQINQSKLIEWLIILLLLLAGHYGLYRLVSNPTFIQLDYIIILSILFIVTVFQIRKGLDELKYLDIYEDKIVIKYIGSLYTKTIYLQDIISFNTFIRDKRNFIDFRTLNASYRFDRNALNNGKELIVIFNRFSHKKDQTINQEITRRKSRQEGRYLGIAGILILTFVLIRLINPDKRINGNELVELNGNLVDEFEIYKPQLRNPGRFYTFKLSQFNKFEFRVNTAGYNSSDIDFIEKDHRNDSVAIYIDRREFEIKIKQSAKPTFSESHFKWPTIEVYGLQVNNKKIFTPKDINSSKDESSKYSLIWTFIGVVLGLELLRRARKAYL